MAEGLEVTIKYRGAKYDQVAAPATSSSEFAILKKDLAHLRVHSPSQKNVRRVNGSFILHWPTAGMNQKVVGLADSLHTRWFKLCSDDPEALKLREFLSIESVTMKQDGVLIRATASKEQASQGAPPGTLAGRLGDPLQETVQQPAHIPLPVKPPPIIPPPRVPPTAPRLDRRPPPHLKRRMSSNGGPSNLTRQKLDVPETPTASPLQSVPVNTQPQQTQSPASPKADQQGGPSTPVDETKAVPQPTRDDADATPSARAHTPTAPSAIEPQTIPTSPVRESGEMTPQPTTTLVSGPPSSSGPGPGLSSVPTIRPPPANHHHHLQPRPASPYQSSSSSGNGDHRSPRRQDRDVNQLTRELWDTRRQLTAMQAREQVTLAHLERLGARPESSSADRNGVSRDELTRLEAELRAERARRMRAERALSEVERECKAPFVVPALFQAFLSISELSN